MKIIRKDIILKPDPKRVIFRPLPPKSRKHALKVIARIMSLTDEEVNNKLSGVIQEFGGRHQKLRDFLMKRFRVMQNLIYTDKPISDERKLLIGAYFTLEYSIESAALFNPSIVWHPDQTNVPAGGKRFIMSLRAIGEGHISSITFRSGIIDYNCEITIDTPKKFVTSSETVLDSSYDKILFEKKLQELGLYTEFVKNTMNYFEDKFTLDQLKAGINRSLKEYSSSGRENIMMGGKMLHLAKSNYEILFNQEQDISERVIFPATPNEINGIEDARFVEFKDEDGASVYFSTYTAYDGSVTFPQLIETKDFLWFKISTLNGPAVHDKDMALFPRKINGLYAMLSRQDGENIYLMFSDMIHFWYTKQIIMRPTFDWEFIQIGSCGSPIEIEEGWLVLSHGVGVMRKYALGAFLLDKNDPTKVLGRTREPILTANENEREGYVPNVIYTCGGIIHNDSLVIPYAMSDYATSFSIVPIIDILAAMS